MQFASVLVVFFVNYWQDKILTPLGSFPQQFVLSPTFPDKTFLSPSFATGKKKKHFPRILTLKPVTWLHTDILIHSLASQGQAPKGRSACCRGVNNFSPNIKAKKKYITRKFIFSLDTEPRPLRRRKFKPFLASYLGSFSNNNGHGNENGKKQ